MRIAIFIQVLALLLANTSFARVRSVTPKIDEVTEIKTALGIATIVQMKSPIQSMIIGDQSGFKVEYLDKAVTIKPLRWGAKTNLYLVTDKRRFNLKLTTQNQETSDYVVYVNEVAEKKSVRWLSHTVSSKGSKDIELILEKIGQTEQGFVLLEGKIKLSPGVTLKPEDFWILQDGKSKTIHSLYLSSKKSTNSRPVTFALAIGKSDLDSKKAVVLEVSVKPKLSVIVPRSLIWN